MWLVEDKTTSQPLGLCGLLRRDSLACVDLGFGILPEYWGKGIAKNAAQICLSYAFETLKEREVAAIVHPDNSRSVRLLKHLGFCDESGYRDPVTDEQLLLLKIGRGSV